METARKRARLIYNPTSGQEIIKKNIAEVLDVLEDVGMKQVLIRQRPLLYQLKTKQRERLKQDLI